MAAVFDDQEVSFDLVTLGQTPREEWEEVLRVQWVRVAGVHCRHFNGKDKGTGARNAV